MNLSRRMESHLISQAAQGNCPRHALNYRTANRLLSWATLIESMLLLVLTPLTTS